MRINKTLVRVGLLIALGATAKAEQRGSVSLAPPPPSGVAVPEAPRSEAEPTEVIER